MENLILFGTSLGNLVHIVSQVEVVEQVRFHLRVYKLLYICRDPKDMFVSLRHFHRELKDKGKGKGNGIEFPLENGFELLCKRISLHDVGVFSSPHPE
ncbi:hypothetical protein LguiB_015898 [Lonicera macranthoides]